MDVLVLPIIFEGEVRGVVELASVERFNPTHQAFLDQLTESIERVIEVDSPEALFASAPPPAPPSRNPLSLN